MNKEIDVEKKANEYTKLLSHQSAFRLGYEIALKDNQEKKYTEEDLKKVIQMARYGYIDFDDNNTPIFEFVNNDEKILQSLN